MRFVTQARIPICSRVVRRTSIAPALSHCVHQLQLRFRIQQSLPDNNPGLASPTANIKRNSMAQNHYVTKTKRRNKSGKRKDPSAATMAALRQRAAADAKKSAK